MPRATFIVELDLNEDGTYEQNITSDVLSATMFRGRSEDLDAAQQGSLTLTLDNSLGKYAPKSATVLSGFAPYKPVRIRTTSPAAASHFTGIITKISVDPAHDQQQVTVTAMDSVEVLRRAIISQRLLQGQPTGIILHRLLDASEQGEHCDNPAFDEDLSGYADGGWGGGGGATSTRVITGTIMEGSAAIETVSTAWGGWRYSIPHTADSEFQSLKITASVYIWAATVADVGKMVRLQLADSATADLGATDLALSMLPQRVSVTGTFGPTATDFYVQAYPTTNATFRTGAVHIISAKVAIPRSLDDGRTRLSYYGSFRKSAMEMIEEVRDNELGGLFFFDGGGSAVFEERTKRLLGTAALGTVDETFWEMEYAEEAEDRFSKIIFNHGKFDIGAPATYVWNLDLPTSRPISVGGTALLYGEYGSFVKDPIKPVGNIDFQVNNQSDGAGRDMLGTVGEGSVVPLTWIPYGEGARYQLVNNSTADTAWITQLAQQATPIRPSSDKVVVEYEPVNPPSLKSELEHSYPLNDDVAAVQSWAGFLGRHYATQRERVSITIRPRTSAILTQMLNRKISDRVKLVNDDKSYATAVNGDYYIEGIRHRISKGGFLHETTWTVSPVHNFYWILGVGKLGDVQSLVTTTVPGP